MTTLDQLGLEMDFSLFTTLTEKPGVTGSHQELYAGLLDMFVLADELGYEAAFVAEHHTAGNENKGFPLVPNPAVMLAALAMRTKRIKLGPGVSVLPFRHPLQVVEDYAMIDQLSGGRLIMGVGSGDPGLIHELEGYNIPEEERVPRYMESLKMIEAAWSGQPVTLEGPHHKFKDTVLNVRPLQDPPPPIHIAVSRPEAAYAVASLGYPIYAVPYNGVANVIAHYRQGRADAGLDYDPSQHWFMFNTFVAQTEDQVREKFANAASRAGTQVDWQKHDQMIADGNWLVGSVDKIAGMLADLHGQGLRKVMLAMDFVVGMPIAEVLEAVSLFAAEVEPRVAERIAAGSAPPQLATA